MTSGGIHQLIRDAMTGGRAVVLPAGVNLSPSVRACAYCQRQSGTSKTCAGCGAPNLFPFPQPAAQPQPDRR